MNADPFRPLPSEDDYRADLGRWPDMAQLSDEDAIIASVMRASNDRSPRWNALVWVIIPYAAAVCVAVAWAVVAVVM